MRAQRRLAALLLALLMLAGCSGRFLTPKTEDPAETSETEETAVTPDIPDASDSSGSSDSSDSTGSADSSGTAETPVVPDAPDVLPDPAASSDPTELPEPSGTSDPGATAGGEEQPPFIEDGHVKSISLDKYAVVVQVGQSDMPWVTMYPESAENKGEVWTSNNTEIASVNSWGKITGVNVGTCQVTVRSADSPDVKAVVDVTVTAREVIHVEQIVLDKEEVNIPVGLCDMPLVTMYPTTATDKGEIWESDNTAIATVNSYGLITGVGIGVCNVTVKSKDNETVTATVPVKVTARPTFSEVTYINGILVVNKTYGLPQSYSPGVDPAAKAALDTMIAAAEQEGIKLWVESGFRSYDLQTTIYTSYVSREGQTAADRYSARPGYSEHQTGLAFDMNSFEDSFGETAEGKWLAEHSWEYGFTMRYPKEKEDITGFRYEPWHVRYLGYDLAKELHESGQVLEEYLGITSQYAG